MLHKSQSINLNFVKKKKKKVKFAAFVILLLTFTGNVICKGN